MSEALFSPSWYRVASLAPRLRSHAALHRHQYRGQIWYVLHDRSNERFHRFSPAAFSFIGLMDGKRSVQEVWDLASSRLGDHAPTQPEVVQLLSQLHAADMLQCDIPPDTAELLARYTPFRHVEGSFMQASFGHLEGYSALYYTYMWSLVIAKDLVSAFRERGLMDPATAARYRKAILEPGGSRPAAALVEAFLGRPSGFEAYQAWLDG